jgi:hypothetical protein
MYILEGEQNEEEKTQSLISSFIGGRQAFGQRVTIEVPGAAEPGVHLHPRGKVNKPMMHQSEKLKPDHDRI